ncbi:MAG: response regulator [Deltaproteobacteria bacterium]|nr:response regulator [Deltaproteobacteria bacterium]MBW1954540.1 response regulator [Deltaproteobacteria bacterium]MBW2042601.1 response regulator [Deltaproteobacteria bacterium]MBW2132972.1 response regulator [Deltaproteobacteria bacterium]
MSKLLIVEDEAITGLQLEETLESMGFEVVGRAMSGKEAVSLAKKHKPDLILMDIVMPGGMNGIQATKKIQAKSDIPVIFITAHEDEKWLEQAKSLQTLGYILKPFNDYQVKATVEIALTRIELERRLKESESALKTERNRLEEMIQERTEELSIKTMNLEDTNAALKTILKKREEDKNELEEKVLLNVKRMILPYLEKLKTTKLNSSQQTYVDIIDMSLKEIISPFAHTLSTKYVNLTPKEVQIANLIKQGKSTKEIAEIFELSKRTIDAHRNHIRRKLGLKKRGGNLRTHLLTLR